MTNLVACMFIYSAKKYSVGLHTNFSKCALFKDARVFRPCTKALQSIGRPMHYLNTVLILSMSNYFQTKFKKIQRLITIFPLYHKHMPCWENIFQCSRKLKSPYRPSVKQIRVYPIIINEPHREKTGFLPMRKQRRRSASR